MTTIDSTRPYPVDLDALLRPVGETVDHAMANAKEFAAAPTFDGLRGACLVQRETWAHVLSDFTYAACYDPATIDVFKRSIELVLGAIPQISDFPEPGDDARAGKYEESIRFRQDLLFALVAEDGGLDAVQAKLDASIDGDARDADE